MSLIYNAPFIVSAALNVVLLVKIFFCRKQVKRLRDQIKTALLSYGKSK